MHHHPHRQKVPHHRHQSIRQMKSHQLQKHRRVIPPVAPCVEHMPNKVMQHAEAVSLIKKAIQATHAERWADLGCGSGTFTHALSDLLPAASQIIAIDQQNQSFQKPGIEFYRADFINAPLPLQQLNGILMANAFHYVKDKDRLITKLENYFAATPRFLLVEYDTDYANTWVPFPISFGNLQSFFNKHKYQITRIGDHPPALAGRCTPRWLINRLHGKVDSRMKYYFATLSW